MILAPETELTETMMSEIAHLATRISFEPVMSVQERNVEVEKIALEAQVVAADIFTLLLQHVDQRKAGGHPSRRSEAYIDLMRFRNLK